MWQLLPSLQDNTLGAYPLPWVIYLHLASVLPAALLGTVLLGMPKGTPRHRQLGRVYLSLMWMTAGVSLCLPAQVGPRWLGHFGWIHGLSLLVLVTVPVAYLAARRRHIGLHRTTMVSLYIGGVWVAGLFAFAPGRLLYRWLIGAH